MVAGCYPFAFAVNGLQPYVMFGCFPKNNKATKLRKGAVSSS